MYPTTRQNLTRPLTLCYVLLAMTIVITMAISRHYQAYLSFCSYSSGRTQEPNSRTPLKRLHANKTITHTGQCGNMSSVRRCTP